MTAPAAGPVEVGIVTLVPQSVTLTRELPGRTSPFLVAEVRPQVTGIVQRRLFTEGGKVQAGDELYQLDDATYRANHQSAEASLARAQAALELARLNATRSAALAKADAVSRQENENATAALRQAEAEVGVAEANVAGAGVVLGYTKIVSPISGRIGKSSVTRGALVTANQDAPLATVQQLDPIYVDVTQSSREWLELRQDLAAGSLQRPDAMPVTIILEDGTPYKHQGKLASTEVTVDPTTGSFGLRVVVPNPDQILLPGMYVRAIVGLGVRQQALLVPQPGIARDPRGNATAMVVNAEGKAELRQVRVSRTLGSSWLVESGLAAGDRVIVEGLQKISPGVPVQPVDARPAPAAASQR
jgi:membrane fusion protein (multidrug efflux system)